MIRSDCANFRKEDAQARVAVAFRFDGYVERNVRIGAIGLHDTHVGGYAARAGKWAHNLKDARGLVRDDADLLNAIKEAIRILQRLAQGFNLAEHTIGLLDCVSSNVWRS